MRKLRYVAGVRRGATASINRTGMTATATYIYNMLSHTPTQHGYVCRGWRKATPPPYSTHARLQTREETEREKRKNDPVFYGDESANGNIAGTQSNNGQW